MSLDGPPSTLNPVDKDSNFDPASATVIKNPRNPTENLLTQAEVDASRRANLDLPVRALPTNQFQSPPVTAQPPTSAGQANMNGAQAIPIPAVGSNPSGPQLSKYDTPRVQDRLNKLFGRMKTAEERNAELENQNAALLSRLETRAPPHDPFNQNFNGNGFGNGGAAPPGAGQDTPVSRQELQAILRQEMQAMMRHNALLQAHTASRSEAERDFPDVFSDPELKAAADDVWARDPALQQDPMGPYKAVLMVRGARVEPRMSFSSGTPADVRKEVISAGGGSSVPEGQAQPPANDRATRYMAALRRAQATGSPDDAAYAMAIKQGQA